MCSCWQMSHRGQRLSITKATGRCLGGQYAVAISFCCACPHRLLLDCTQLHVSVKLPAEAFPSPKKHALKKLSKTLEIIMQIWFQHSQHQPCLAAPVQLGRSTAASKCYLIMQCKQAAQLTKDDMTREKHSALAACSMQHTILQMMPAI